MLSFALRNFVHKCGPVVLQVDDIVIPNQRGRYFLNWVKLRAWQWDEYDAVILLDADAVVLGDLTHLFKLPTNFAWASQNGHTGYDWNRGGMIMMRPCKVRGCPAVAGREPTSTSSRQLCALMCSPSSGVTHVRRARRPLTQCCTW